MFLRNKIMIGHFSSPFYDIMALHVSVVSFHRYVRSLNVLSFSNLFVCEKRKLIIRQMFMNVLPHVQTTALGFSNGCCKKLV